jgi:hypothetical protein
MPKFNSQPEKALTEEGSKVSHNSGTSFHNFEWNKGLESFLGEPFFIDNETDESSRGNKKRYEGSPVIPRVHDATPGQWNQEACERSNEQNRSNPVDFSKLFHKPIRSIIESQVKDDHGGANANEGQIDPENPAPRDILREASAQKWASYRALVVSLGEIIAAA